MSQNLNPDMTANLKHPSSVKTSHLVGPTHPTLTMPSLSVTHGMDVKPLIALMKSTMADCGGLGIAANQVGVLQRVIVVRVGGFRETIINPVITKRYGGLMRLIEASSSYPGLQVRVRRHKQIIIEGFTPDWKPIHRKLKGITAVCVQHEVDHLDGITIATIKSLDKRCVS